MGQKIEQAATLKNFIANNRVSELHIRAFFIIFATYKLMSKH